MGRKHEDRFCLIRCKRIAHPQIDRRPIVPRDWVAIGIAKPQVMDLGAGEIPLPDDVIRCRQAFHEFVESELMRHLRIEAADSRRALPEVGKGPFPGRLAGLPWVCAL
jgi:hypothetical protein